MSPLRFGAMVLGLLVLAVAVMAVAHPTLDERAKYDECIRSAKQYRFEFGWEPDGGIEAWCVTVMRD